MALPECLLQGGEGWAEEGQAEEGRMSKHHKVSGGGTTKGGIGMDGGEGCHMSSSQSFVAGVH